VDVVYFSPKGRFVVVQGRYGAKGLVETRTGVQILKPADKIGFSDDERFVLIIDSEKLRMYDAAQLIRQAKQ
jgi:hypothetical protein